MGMLPILDWVAVMEGEPNKKLNKKIMSYHEAGIKHRCKCIIQNNHNYLVIIQQVLMGKWQALIHKIISPTLPIAHQIKILSTLT